MSTPVATPLPAPTRDAIIDIRRLEIAFPSDEGGGGLATVVRDVSFAAQPGTTLGLVGESGCGKSMTGLALLRLTPRPGRITSGQILFQPAPGAPVVDLAALDAGSPAVRAIRGNRIAMVFQEPMSSLNPVYTIGQQIGESVMLHKKANRKEARERSIEMLKRVGMPAPHLRVDEYPHQLSGGMRQRAVIALALACDPALLIADEPTTALDVTVQAQIIDLLRELQAELGMAILMISHDLGVIADLCDDVIVMYAGRIVERAPVDQIFDDPKHPYTRGLLKAMPHLGAARTAGERLYAIPGTVPDPIAPPRGCPFRPRCPERFAPCKELPELIELAPNHLGRCWARQQELEQAASEVQHAR